MPVHDRRTQPPTAPRIQGSAQPRREGLEELYPAPAPEDPVERLMRERAEADAARDADRRERATDRFRQTALEFSLLFAGVHWMIHGLGILTLSMTILLGLGLAYATERWFLGRYVVTLLGLIGYGIPLNCTAALSPVGLIVSIVLVTCGLQVLRIPRESEWQGV